MLDDVLAKYPNTRVIIEMKGGQPELARAVAASIHKAEAVNSTCVGSFHQGSIDAIRAEDPDIFTSASQEEARWMLHRSWVRWPFTKTRPYHAFQLPEFAGRMRVVSRASDGFCHERWASLHERGKRIDEAMNRQPVWLRSRASLHGITRALLRALPCYGRGIPVASSQSPCSTLSII